MNRKKKPDSTRTYLRRRKKHFLSWFEAMGLGGFLEALSPAMARFILSYTYPAPDIEFPDAPAWWPEVRKKIDADWSTLTFDPFENGHKLPATQTMTIYPSAVMAANHFISEDPDLARRFKSPPSAWLDLVATASNRLALRVVQRLMEVASVDHMLVRVQPPRLDRQVKGKLQCVWRLSAIQPQMEQVELKGKPRPIYRVAAPVARPEALWAEFDATVLGLSARTGKLPVYIQSHALRRLEERLTFWPSALDGTFTWFGARAQACAAESMSEPKVVRQKGTEFMVEFRMADKKIGYLVAELVKRKAVIKTFLLSGMQGTPEAKLLRKKLRVGRKEVQWLRMDNLKEWLLSDLRFDPVIRQIVQECGLSDLLHFADLGDKYYFTESADMMRRFLGDDLIQQATERANQNKQALPAFLSRPEKLVA